MTKECRLIEKIRFKKNTIVGYKNPKNYKPKNYSFIIQFSVGK